MAGVIIPEWVIYVFYFLFAYAAITLPLFILMFVWFGKIIITFFKAKIKKGIILPVIGARTVDFQVAEFHEGLLETKQYGAFIADPHSIYIIKGTNIPIAFAYFRYGATLKPELVLAATILKNMGIENIEEAEKYAEALQKQGKSFALKIPEKAIIKWEDIIGFFKYNVNPTFIRSRIEKRVAAFLEEHRKFNWQILVYVGIFLFLGVIAFIVLQDYLQAGEWASKYAACMAELGKYKALVGEAVNQTAKATATKVTGVMVK
jgi:hypothetical protein